MFQEASARVIVISFGSLKGAQAWLEDTGCGLELYLDPARVLYSWLGLGRSVWRVWQMTTLQYYASMKAQGRQLPTAVEGVEDDPLQMGGDFTFRCEDNTLSMSHPSKTPRDRPAVADILKRLK